MTREVAVSIRRFARLAVALPVAAGALLVPEPQLFGGNRCGGQTPPMCREVEKCYGIGSHYRCTVDHFYFPADQ